MLSFRQFLIEYNLLLENKRQDFINRFLKIHSDHPLVQDNPEQAGSLIAHSMSFGQNADEHNFLTRQLLDGTYKPEEDEPTIQMVLGKWRKAKQKNLVTGSLKDHTHDSVSALFSDIPELRVKTTTQHRGLEELAEYHIGEIEHPNHGTLQVYHVHHSDVNDFEEYKRISAALRKTCQSGEYTWCVLPKEKDTGPRLLEHYSKGSGIFFYVNEEGTPVLSHGHKDRGIVNPGNKEVDGGESKQVFGETLKLLSGEKKVSHILANQKHVDSDQIKSAVEDPSFGNDPVHLEYALFSPHESVALAAVEHPDFGSDPNHITAALQSSHGSVERAAVEHPSFGRVTSDISIALRSFHGSVARAAVEHPSFGSSVYHIGEGLRSPHEFVARAAVEHPDFGKLDYHITDALRSPYESIARAAIEHFKFKTTHNFITDALQSSHESIQRAAVEHPSFVRFKSDINIALRSPHESVARAALEHPNLRSVTSDISVALRSPHESVARTALDHPSFRSNPDSIYNALLSPYEFVQKAAVEHPDFGSDADDIYDALFSPHESVALAALKHPDVFTTSHLEVALNNRHKSVRQLAQQMDFSFLEEDEEEE